MSVVRVAVACRGPLQLAERAAALATHLSSTSAAGARVVVALVPPVRPLLTAATVGEWSGALAALYTEARALDLTVTLGEGGGDEVVDLTTLPASPYTPPPPRSTDRLYQEVHPSNLPHPPPGGAGRHLRPDPRRPPHPPLHGAAPVHRQAHRGGHRRAPPH